MKGFFLPSGDPTVLLPGDQIIFTQLNGDLEILEFFRRGRKLKFAFSSNQIVERIEFSRTGSHFERIKEIIMIAAAAGTNYKFIERGERQTIFQLVIS